MGDDDHDREPFFSSGKNSFDINNKIMVTAIISLSLVIFFVLALHLYARCVLRRQSRRRAANRTLTLSALSYINSTEQPSSGLNQIVIGSLPVFSFKQTDQNSTTECAVCLSNLEDQETVMLLPNCKHVFHVECVKIWLGSNSTCPICRTEAEPTEVAAVAPVDVAVMIHDEHREVPTAPPLENMGSARLTTGGCGEGITVSDGFSKGNGSGSSRLSSFRKMLTREKSSTRINNLSSGNRQDGTEDIER